MKMITGGYIPPKDIVVKEVKAKIPIKYNHFGAIRPKIKGGTIYVCDPKKETIKPVEYEVEKVYPAGFGDIHSDTKRKKMVIQKGMIYIEALNLKNALIRLGENKILFTT